LEALSKAGISTQEALGMLTGTKKKENKRPKSLRICVGTWKKDFEN
jgi:hypothetical protein